MPRQPHMNKVIRLKLDASLLIVSSVHVVRTTGSLFSEYDLRVSERDYVTTGIVCCGNCNLLGYYEMKV